MAGRSRPTFSCIEASWRVVSKGHPTYRSNDVWPTGSLSRMRCMRQAQLSLRAGPISVRWFALRNYGPSKELLLEGWCGSPP